ncbi:uncharacterized protein [Procambarus clarkii]|uniref:uncharacterized protein n=1 Tax=Procambarus clarkii TaxID=6728 RepID=UPI001E6750FD|nr:putative carbonic anhydrase 2 [Procambarus clarkii]
MKLFLELVATAVAFLTIASAQNAVLLDDVSARMLDQWTSDEDTSELHSVAEGPLIRLLKASELQYEPYPTDDVLDPGDHLDPETHLDSSDDLYYDDDDNDTDDNDTDDNNNLDLDSEEDEDLSEERQNIVRFKRKVIFGGGGGYSSGMGRRGGGGGGSADPYGRRRGGNYQGPDYGNYDYSYGQQTRGDFVDTSSYGASQNSQAADASGSSSAAKPIESSDTGVVYGTPVASSASTITGTSRSPGTARTYGVTRASAIDADSNADTPSTSGRKSKTGRREVKKKLSKTMKWEIAEYAIEHGAERAADRYAHVVDRRLSPKKIEKFMERYKKQLRKNQRHQQ